MRKIEGVFNILDQNKPIEHCTVSECLYEAEDIAVSLFSLGTSTDISAEAYPTPVFILCTGGNISTTISPEKFLKWGDAIFVKEKVDNGIKAFEDSSYIEFLINKKDMNDKVSLGDIFALKDLVEYADGKVVNLDVINNPKVKFFVMSFDAGCQLREHAAPGEALVFALEGEGIITYEGKEHVIKVGENFVFEKGGLHSVKADKRFKMALLLTL